MLSLPLADLTKPAMPRALRGIISRRKVARENLRQPERLVRVRLYGENPPLQIVLKSKGGLLIGKHRLEGSVTIAVQGKELWARSGRKKILQTSLLRVRALTGTPIEIGSPHHPSRVTRGDLRITIKKGRLVIVDILDLESYVDGIVEPELGSLNLPIEAMKSQIISSRSYALAMHTCHPGESYEFCDSPHCQVYAGIGHSSPRLSKAIADARGWILTYHGRPAAAFFHHSCGGSTAAIEHVWPGPAIPYLRSVKDGRPAYCSNASFSRWTFHASRRMLKKCFAQERWLQPTEALDTLRVLPFPDDGRPRQVLIQGNGPRWVLADRMRHAINKAYGSEVLLSAFFEIKAEGDQFRFEGRGWGHGVGLCQSGAIEMARQHKTAAQILDHYYPGTKLQKLRPITAEDVRIDPVLRNYLASLED